MSRTVWRFVLGAIVWIAWCVLVVLKLVPLVRLHITMWPWLMAYTLCLAPIIAAALRVIIRIRNSADA